MIKRAHKIEDINLRVDYVRPFHTNSYECLIIGWSSDIGFGEYTFCKNTENSESVWKIDSENMDRGEDKDFGRALLSLWMDKCIVL